MNIKATAKHLCPSCNSALRRIKGKKGFFWVCSDRSCKHTAPDSRGKPGKKRKAFSSKNVSKKTLTKAVKNKSNPVPVAHLKLKKR